MQLTKAQELLKSYPFEFLLAEPPIDHMKYVDTANGRWKETIYLNP